MSSKWADLRQLWPFYLSWIFECFAASCLFTTTVKFMSDEYGKRGVWVGIMLSSYAIMTIFGNVFMGSMADKMDPRKVLAFLFGWNALLSLITAASPNFSLFFASRILAGACGNSPPLAFAYVGTRAESVQASHLYAAVASIYSFCYIIIPIFIGFVSEGLSISSSSPYYLKRFPFFVSTCFSCLAAVLMVTIVPKKDRMIIVSNNSKFNFALIRKLACSGMGEVWLSRLCASWAQLAVSSTLWSLCEGIFPDELNFSSRIYHACLSVGGLTALVSQMVLFNLIESRIGTYGGLYLGLFLMGLGLITYIGALRLNSYFVLMAVGFVWLGIGFYDVCIPSVIRSKLSLLGDSDLHSGLNNGIVTSFKSFSQVLSPLVANILFDINREAVYYEAIAACFLGTVFACLAANKHYAGIFSPKL